VAGHNSRVRLNATHGNGYSEPADDFGIGVIGTASGNVIDGNNVTGNTNGILVGAATRQTMIRQNIVLGNPGIQVANTSPQSRAADIVNLSPTGQTTFERNTCVTALNAPCPAIQRAPK
jgi:parallel beta-helix repeat protein